MPEGVMALDPNVSSRDFLKKNPYIALSVLTGRNSFSFVNRKPFQFIKNTPKKKKKFMKKQAFNCPGRNNKWGCLFAAKMHFFETLLSRSPSQCNEMKPKRNSPSFEHPPLHGDYELF